MRQYKLTIIGKSPLLMHQDNVDWADYMDAWRSDPHNSAASKAGDDRTPAWRWLGSVYHNNNVVGIPSENIMRSIMEGGVMVPVPGGRSGKTFKAQTQSGMMSVDPFWPLLTKDGRSIDWAAIHGLKDVASFADHKSAADKLGFGLLVKRAKIGQSKHIRVRPIFDTGWSVTGALYVWDDQISKEILTQILGFAGQYKGLGDWRPGGKTPGPYGMFTAEVDG